MDWGAVKNGLVQTALATMFAGAAGYLFGTSQTAQIANDVREMRTDMKTWRDQSIPRRTYLGDVGNRTEFLCNQSPQCRARFQPLQVPE